MKRNHNGFSADKILSLLKTETHTSLSCVHHYRISNTVNVKTIGRYFETRPISLANKAVTTFSDGRRFQQSTLTFSAVKTAEGQRNRKREDENLRRP